MSAREIVMNAVTSLFVTFDPEAAKEFLHEDYIQHNPAIPTGRAAILALVPQLEAMGVTAEVHRVIAEGDLVVLHTTYDNMEALGAKKMVAFDVFRVEDGLVVEHWDNLQPYVPASETANGNSMVDGATEITDLDQTQANRALVLGYIDDVLRQKAPEKIMGYVGAYIQHNPQIANGPEGLMAAYAAMEAAGTPVAFGETHLVVAEGNFVFTASDGKLGDQDIALFDLFRVEDGKIAEHWDTISPIPTEMAHGNGKF